MKPGAPLTSKVEAGEPLENMGQEGGQPSKEGAKVGNAIENAVTVAVEKPGHNNNNNNNNNNINNNGSSNFSQKEGKEVAVGDGDVTPKTDPSLNKSNSGRFSHF